MAWRSTGVRRTATTLTVVLGLIPAGVLGPTAVTAAPVTVAAPGGPPPSPPAGRKIDPGLRRGLDATGTADFVVSFAARAELAGTDRGSWARRGKAVYDTLNRTAAQSQREVRRRLDAAGVRYRAFSVANVVYVFGGSEQLASQLAGRAEVSRLTPARIHALPDPPRSKARVAAVDDVEWGIAHIRANQVWSEFADRGEGIVVANIDTGVQYDHPALAASYRGRQAGGTIRHDYNWYDPAAVCPPGLGPCDNAGHGTHTMGTMVGDAGAGNRIGVAPGAKWIAAKGCEDNGCSTFALLASAQWMLAPTDQQGGNARPDLRPHIVNNSWGAPTGSDEDPWYDEAIENWIAAGIFPAFANGNSGPACDTAETPGDSRLAYAVGAYASNGSIASFSSRGPGAGEGEEQDVKPNVAAPGVAVRSSLPGGTYAAWDGTSMATPHLAATVALVWAAAPAVLGDVVATRALLDGAAVDVADVQCGGTAGDNNVYGEGRLDAYAAVQAAPRGPTGTLRGIVRSATGEPLGNAQVRLGGPSNRRLSTGPDGGFAALQSAGSYQVTVGKFGYFEQTVDITVVAGAETVRDFVLQPRPRVTVSGTVTEGPAHRWPVYAELVVDGMPDGTFHTDPATGRYQFELPVEASYSMRVSAAYPGLPEELVELEVDDGDLVRDVRLVADRYDCAAPGYRPGESRILTRQTFDEPTTPPDWTVTDPLGNHQVWRFDDDRGFGNRTGGEGLYGWVFSAGYGPDAEQDTSLVSPPVDLTGVTTPAVWFDTDYSDGSSSTADVDLSLDGGETWTNVWRQTRPSIFGSQQMVPIPAAAGHTGVQVRFRYVASFDSWWQVDNVAFGDRVCEAAPGALAVGHVRDANTGRPLNGATVAGPSGVRTITEATPADAGLDDGFYWMFVPGGGSTAMSAAQPRYQPDEKTVELAADRTTRVDFAPTAGVIEVSRTAIAGWALLGGRTTATLTVRNDGTAAATVDVTERHGDFTPAATGAGTPVRRVAGTFSTGPGPRTGSGSPVVLGGATGGPWTSLADYPVPIQDNAVGYHEGELYSVGGRTPAGVAALAYRYDPETAAWTRIADLPRPRQRASAGFLAGKLYVAGGWTSTSDARADMDVYDPHTGTWSTGVSLPRATTAAGTAVLGDQLYVVGGCLGECGDREVFRYDASDRRWQRLADYPRDTSWLACGGIGTAVYCAGGVADDASNRTYRYDPAANTWTRLADLPDDLWGMATTVAAGKLLVSGGVIDGALTNEGFGYDPASNTWSALPNSAYAYYRGGSACGFAKVGGSAGNFLPSPLSESLPGHTDCGDADPVSWLAVNPATITLAPHSQAEVTVTLDAGAVDQPGAYSAALQTRDNTPYAPSSVTVDLQVAAPADWGKLAGTVSGRGCDGQVQPLPGATIRMDGPLADYTLRSGATGGYGRWMDRRNSPVRLIVTRDGWFPTTGDAQIRAGQTTVRTFTLNRTGCPVGTGRTR